MKIRRLVIKLGTGILSRESGAGLDQSQFRRIAEEVAALKAEGMETLLVSSGAVAAGICEMGLGERPSDLAGKQACAATGQPALMRAYHDCFHHHGLLTAQLLLSHDDIDSRLRRSNARNTLERLLSQKNIVPVVNENDSVAVEELRFGDNDRLSAEVAVLAEADFLVMLTSVEGLMDSSGSVVPVVDDIDSAFAMVTGESGKFSVGGMRTKLEAAKMAKLAGIPSCIASGRIPGILQAIARGKPIGTFFPSV